MIYNPTQNIAALIRGSGGSAGLAGVDVIALPEEPVAGISYRLTVADDVAKAPPGLYVHDGDGWMCTTPFDTYDWGDLGATPNLALITGGMYTWNVNEEITGATITLSKKGMIAFVSSNGAGNAWIEANTTATGRIIRTVKGGAFTNLAETDGCTGTIADDGTSLWLTVAKSDDPGFVTTWLTTEDNETITLPLRSGYTYDMLVDWGDGSNDEITAHDQAEITHEYASAGTQTVKITGTCESWYFNNGGSKRKFRTVESWGDVGFIALDSAFLGCTNATFFGHKMPAYEATSLEKTWCLCNSALSFPDISALAGVTTLKWTWYGCYGALRFPGISTFTDVTTMEKTWYHCTSCEIVPVLPASSADLINIDRAFSNIGSGMGGTVVELWDTVKFPNITSHAWPFYDATGLDNYADIPTDWKL